MKSILTLTLFVLSVVCLSATEFRLEADLFATRQGKWSEGLAVANTGNKYLVAMERKAALSGQFSCPEAGTYTVWAYTLSMNEGWRQCEVKVNGQVLGKFGDKKNPDIPKGKHTWYWHKLDVPVTLPAGDFTIDMVSPMGMARIDFLVFTPNPVYVPGGARKDWEKIEVLKSTQPLSAIEQLPKAQGKGAPILMFHGARPWVGNDTAAFLVKAGASVVNLNSVYLDGLGGSSIKRFLSDKEEPKAKDGITPAMECLDAFKLVFVTAIPEANQSKIFTPERVNILRKYVEKGGNLLVTIDTPATMNSLLPVIVGSSPRSGDGILTVKRPDSPEFSCLPESWRQIDRFRKLELKAGAKILMPIVNESGERAGIFAAEWTIGQGKVVYLNAAWNRLIGMRQIYTWAYGQAVVAALATYTGNLGLHPEKTIYSIPEPPERKQHGELTVTVAQPELDVKESNAEGTIDGKSFRLPNGIRGTVQDDGKLAFTWPGATVPYVKNMEPPIVTLSSEMADIDEATAELKEGAKKGVKTLAGNWQLTGIKPCAGGVILSYTNEKTELKWRIGSGIFEIDGVKYLAFSDEPQITACPVLVHAVRTQSELSLGATLAGHRCRRMSCYSPPRGIAEYDFSGAVAANTTQWGFFASGQPFTWVTAPAGIYSEFVDTPVVTEVQLGLPQGATAINQSMIRQIGYRKAPVGMAKAWHAFTTHVEKDHNEWMAMYQFQRLHLRDKVGLPSLPPVPTVTWQNLCSKSEVDDALKVAAEMGFKRANIPLCPSPISTLRSEGLYETFARIKKVGLIPFPWTAGDYSHGNNEALFVNHKDWYLREQTGKIHYYGGETGHPVIDLNNPDFQNWYFETLDMAINNGMGAVYFDMYGTAIGNVNYAKPDSPACLDGALKIIRYLLTRGVTIGVEGQNPLVHDNWWYRQSKYDAPFQGKEYSILCSSPSSGNCGDDMALDYFRTSMYCTFLYVGTDGYPKRFERVPKEIERIERMGRLNPKINRAIEVSGYPFIRDTPFGTSWIGKDGGALFFYDAAQKVTVNLPKGWEIEGVSGNVLTNVAPDSIYILRAPASKH